MCAGGVAPLPALSPPKGREPEGAPQNNHFCIFFLGRLPRQGTTSVGHPHTSYNPNASRIHR